MRLWLLLFGGMLVWAVHFVGIYAIASVFDVIASSDASGSRIATGILTLACLTADATIIFVTLFQRGRASNDPVVTWMMSVGALLAAISFLSVAWQGLPALLG